MAAALFRGGTGLFVRCFHRELCRVLWRPQAALFSSKPSDKKEEQRRTHIKKAKPQPAIDVAKLLEQLFSQRRPDTAPPSGKARPTKPPVPKKNASALSSQPKSSSPTNTVTSNASEIPQHAPLGFAQGLAAHSVSSGNVSLNSTEAAPLAAETGDTKVEAAAEPVEFKAATAPSESDHMVEPNVEMTPSPAAAAEPSVETPAPADTQDFSAVAGKVPAQGIETRDTDSGIVMNSNAAKEQETIVESPEESSHFFVETQEARAAVVEAAVDLQVEEVESAREELQVETTGESSVAVSHKQDAASDPVQALTEATADLTVENTNTVSEAVYISSASEEPPPAPAVQTSSTDSEPSVETTVDPPVEENSGAQETLQESRDSAAAASVEALIETEANAAASAAETSSNGKDAADLPSHSASTQNTEEPAESRVESASGSVESEQMTLESVTLHNVNALVQSLKSDELLQTKSTLDEKVEEQLQEMLVQTATGAGSRAAAEAGESSEEQREFLTKALSNWDSLSEDLQELEGESGVLVAELFCHVPAEFSKAGAAAESLQTGEETMTLESITLNNVKAEVGSLEAVDLLETREALEKEAEVLIQEENMEVGKRAEEEVTGFEDMAEAEPLTLDSVSEATEALEAETAVILEAMFGSEQGSRHPPSTLHTSIRDQNLEPQTEASEQEGNVLEAMTLESVTLAEVEASLGTLENELLCETTQYLEKEAQMLAGEKNVEVAPEETTEALTIESLPEGDVLLDELQTDALMAELFFSIPGHSARAADGPVAQDAKVESVDVSEAAAVTDDCPASSVLKEAQPEQEEVQLQQEEVQLQQEEVQLQQEEVQPQQEEVQPEQEEVQPEQEVQLQQEEVQLQQEEVQLQQEEEEQVQPQAETEAPVDEDVSGIHADLDPVQRLFLDKIREYKNMHGLNEGRLEAEPDYAKHLSEETAKLQRLYGGGDLDCFPEFTFAEPDLDQDSK
ncbi:uncharacterized protein V6R79_011954 [Siganus canaliculatus]